MTTFFFSRHGETVWHAENRYAGLTDVQLTDHGHEQAEELASWAAAANLTAIRSSPLSRAEATARKAATATGLTLTTDTRFRELDFGDGEGLTTAEMRARFPTALEAFHRDPVTHHLPGGEHPTDAATRFRQALNDLSNEDLDGRILIVAHSTVLRLVLCTLLGISTSDYRRVFPKLKNCSLTELTMGERHPALLAFNADPIPRTRATSPPVAEPASTERRTSS